MAKRLTVAERHPKLYGRDGIRPHPDGLAWARCCIGPEKYNPMGHCQCVMAKSKYDYQTSRADRILSGAEGWPSLTKALAALRDTKGRFFCNHRKTDDGYHRECAGWAAKITKHPTIRRK